MIEPTNKPTANHTENIGHWTSKAQRTFICLTKKNGGRTEIPNGCYRENERQVHYIISIILKQMQMQIHTMLMMIRATMTKWGSRQLTLGHAIKVTSEKRQLIERHFLYTNIYKHIHMHYAKPHVRHDTNTLTRQTQAPTLHTVVVWSE